MNNKGFTLIELLVVIAIIGILAGIIIVSLNGSSESARDARIQSALDQMRPVAYQYKIANGDYCDDASCADTGDLDDDAQIMSILGDLTDQQGKIISGGALANPSANTDFLTITQSAWCAYAYLPGGGCACYDSTGNVVKGTAADVDAEATVGATCQCGAVTTECP